MKKTFTMLTAVPILSWVAAAHAGGPMQLSDRQMDAVIAGSAQAIAAFQTSASGQHAAIRTSVANIAAEFPYGSVAQNRTALFSTATGNAAIATNTFSQSSADGHGPPQVATASTAGSANGGKATVAGVAVTTAISASDRSARSSIGLAESLAQVTAFSVSGRSQH
jgi:hypothetical protein